MLLYFRGFSYVDLVEESSSRKLFALKRLTCHSKEEENVALQEVEIMRRISHPNVVPLVGHMVVQVGHHSKTMDIVSEVFIVMPHYSVSVSLTRPVMLYSLHLKVK